MGCRPENGHWSVRSDPPILYQLAEAGSSINLTVEEYANGVDVDGAKVISVKNHKTGSLGPAKLSVEKELEYK